MEEDDGVIHDFWGLPEDEREALRPLDPMQQEIEEIEITSSEGVEAVLVV